MQTKLIFHVIIINYGCSSRTFSDSKRKELQISRKYSKIGPISCRATFVAFTDCNPN